MIHDGTYHQNTLKHEESHGYYVATATNPLVIPQTLARKLDIGDAVRMWQAYYCSVVHKNSNLLIGIWTHNKQVYIEPAIWTPYASIARSLARRYKQQFIWSCKLQSALPATTTDQ